MNLFSSFRGHSGEIEAAHSEALALDQRESDHAQALDMVPETKNFTLDSAEAFDIFTGGAMATSGASVTVESAMRVSAVYSCVRIISSAIAGLKLKIYEQTADSPTESPNHPLYNLFNVAPHHRWSSSAAWEYLVASLLLQGDGISAIIRKGSRPVSFLPFNRSSVEIREFNDRLIYTFTRRDNTKFNLDQDDVLHFPNMGFDGYSSPSTIQSQAKNAIGLALTADEYASLFFANGAKPDFALKTDGNLKDDAVRILRETWMKKHGGMNRHLPAVLTGGLDIKELTMNAVDAQLLETRKFNVIDIARIFGVPPHMIGENEKTSSWGAGIENLGIAFVKYTLKPHLTRIEQEINKKLFISTPGVYAKFNVDGLMRGDSKSQAEYLSRALGGSASPGWMTQNEVRKIQKLPKINNPEADQLTTWSTETTQTDPKENDSEPQS